MKELKKKLREEIKKEIMQLDDEYCKMADAAICEKVLGLKAFRDSKRVCLFASSFGEPDTFPIIEAAFSMGKEVALPLCLDGSKMVFKIIQSLSDLSSGRYGILEPESHCCEMMPLQVEFILVPCVTASENGERLGHGRGYYDRFLGQYDGENEPFKCVICRGRLMRNDIPWDDFDVKMDAVIWENCK